VTDASRSILPRATIPRFERPSAGAFIAWVIVVGLAVWSVGGVGLSPERLARGLPAGSQIEFAHRAALADAIAGRRKVN
jgi:hypothetical protein